jgi:hypothetical protein
MLQIAMVGVFRRHPSNTTYIGGRVGDESCENRSGRQRVLGIYRNPNIVLLSLTSEEGSIEGLELSYEGSMPLQCELQRYMMLKSEAHQCGPTDCI